MPIRPSHSLVVVTSASWAAPTSGSSAGIRAISPATSTREGHDFADLTAEVVDSALAAGTNRRVRHRGRAPRQRVRRDVRPPGTPRRDARHRERRVVEHPASRHEAACASGSVAALAAIADLRSGAYRTALVIGVELEKTVPGDTAAQYLGAAAWTDHEGTDAKFMWPHMFDRVAGEYDRRYGIDEIHLRAIARSTSPTHASIRMRRPAIGQCRIR